MSIGVWAVYAALICVLGGLYVKGFRNAVHSDPPTANVTTEAPATEKTTSQDAESRSGCNRQRYN